MHSVDVKALRIVRNSPPYLVAYLDVPVTGELLEYFRSLSRGDRVTVSGMGHGPERHALYIYPVHAVNGRLLSWARVLELVASSGGDRPASVRRARSTCPTTWSRPRWNWPRARSSRTRWRTRTRTPRACSSRPCAGPSRPSRAAPAHRGRQALAGRRRGPGAALGGAEDRPASAVPRRHPSRASSWPRARLRRCGWRSRPRLSSSRAGRAWARRR